MKIEHILIADDDIDFCNVVAEALEAAGGFSSEIANTSQAVEEIICTSQASFSALLLDVRLPDGDGRDLCARLRHHGYDFPVIMISGLEGEDDVVLGLDRGADTYLRKPVTSSELIARLRRMLPQSTPNHC